LNPPAGPSGERGEGTPPPRPHARRDTRAVLALGGPVLFTPPALALADREATVFGVPALVAYVLGAWLLGILLTFLVARRDGRR
jgi:hypothetical protein